MEEYEQGNEQYEEVEELDVPEVSWLGTKEDLDFYFGTGED